ncbi:MAG TPA: SRPBCC domain-containing protein [Actinophytocola sp.]|nr:SRPBCC domain-containing protein [Actinophytocola sp.]
MSETTRELTITRLFDAPRELVFRCWTEPDQLAKWFGPTGFVAPSVTANAVAGGAWRICIRDTDGVEHWASGVYVEVVAPERLVFSFRWDAEDERQELEDTLVTIAFADRDGKTEMTFHQSGFVSDPSRDGHVAGWRESFDDLAAHLGGERS